MVVAEVEVEGWRQWLLVVVEGGASDNGSEWWSSHDGEEVE